MRRVNEVIMAQRKEYLDMICGPVNEANMLTEEQMAEGMKTRVSAEDVLREVDAILQNGGK